MTDELNITVHLTEKEWVKFNYHTFTRMRLIKIFLMLVLVYIVVAMLNILVGTSLTPLTLVYILLGLVGYMVLLAAIIYFRAVRAYKMSKFKVEKLNYTFREDGFSYQNEVLDVKVSWNAIHKVRETKDWILLYHNERTASMIIKDQLTPEQKNKLLQLIAGLGILNKKLL